MYLVDGCCITDDYGIVGKERTWKTLAEVLEDLSHIMSNLCHSIHIRWDETSNLQDL